MDFVGWATLGVGAVGLYYQRKQALAMTASTNAASAKTRWYFSTPAIALVVLVALAWTPRLLQVVEDNGIMLLPLTTIQNRHFKDEPVKLDGKAFYNCTFEHVNFLYHGGRYFIDPDSKFIDPNDVTATNPAASNTLGLLFRYGIIGKQPQAGIHLLPHGS